MRVRRALGMTAAVALLAAPTATAQQPASPATYTFVAEWDIPRAQWGTYVTDFETHARPVLEKLAADGTLVGWGGYEAIVHSENAPSHGTWWSSTTIAGIERARAELVRMSVSMKSLASAEGHRDYLLRGLIGNGKSGSGTNGYLSVSTYVVKPMQGQEWRRLWEQYTKPVMDELVSSGTLIGYTVDTEYVHTTNPGLRMIATLSPSAEAEDKIDAAMDAAFSKRPEEERRKVGEAFSATLEPGAHRDSYMRVIRYWMK